MLVSCAQMRVVLDVPVSPSSVVTEFVMVSLVARNGTCGTAALLFVQKRARGDEVRRLLRDSASDNEKKDDTAHTYAKFVHLL